jgi:glycosyltransferase involved in cell wall biosynthesis
MKAVFDASLVAESQSPMMPASVLAEDGEPHRDNTEARPPHRGPPSGWVRERERLLKRIELQHRSIETLQKAIALAPPKDVLRATVELAARSPRYRRRVIPVPSVSDPWWPSHPLPKQGLQPTPGHACYSLKGKAFSVVGVAVLGLDQGALERAVALISGQQRLDVRFAPVFLTDSLDHDAFRRHGYVFEYFPKGGNGTRASSTDIRRWEGRIRILSLKWGFGLLIDLGAQTYRLSQALVDEMFGARSAAGGALAVRTPNNPPSPNVPASGATSTAAEHPLDHVRYNSWLQARVGEFEGALSGLNVRGKDQTQTTLAPAKSSRTRKSVAATSPFVGTSVARRKVTVVAWDMGHNACGRAFLLADMLARHHDVELVGPLFPRFGKTIWEPIRKAGLTMRTFPGTNFPEFLGDAAAFAATVDAEVVVVSKPRLPSLLLGLLVKERTGCPMIVDVDDNELSFFAGATPLGVNDLGAAKSDDLHIPFERTWTMVCDAAAREADLITVSNSALRDLFGGITIRHARNEALFDENTIDRSAERARFAYGPEDRIILFLGTPRVHKGIIQIAEALQAIDNPRYALCIIGGPFDKGLSETLKKYPRARIDVFGPQPFHQLPQILSIADLVCVLQETASKVSDFQIPAKISDALAMNKPVLATRRAPLVELIDAGILIEARPNLAIQVDEILSGPPHRAASEHIRDQFLGEFSYAANLARFDSAFDALHAAPIGKMQSGILKQIRQRFGRRRITPATPAIMLHSPVPLDLAFFWKQNDSNIYGRRPDMMLRHLSRHPRVRRVVHFDYPIAQTDLSKLVSQASTNPSDQAGLIARQTLDRLHRRLDTKTVDQRTFLFSARKDDPTAPTAADYPSFVRSALEEASINPNEALFLVCPCDEFFPAVARALRPRWIVADVIDDHRAWPGHSSYREKLQRNYEEILGMANFAMANCEPVWRSINAMCREVHLVPNAAEFDGAFPPRPRQRHGRLRDLAGHIVGYVGNLRDRIDFDLIRVVASCNTDLTFVLIGSAHDQPEVARLTADCSNVHWYGTIPYEEAKLYIRSFDVAIVPHIDNDLTRNMNPLKIFVYLAEGVPIVSTPIANIDLFKNVMTVANGPREFGKAIRTAIGTREAIRGNHALARRLIANSWQARVERFIDIFDRRL